MKKHLLPFILILLSLLCFSCEESITYTSHLKNFQEDTLEECKTAQCPDISIEIEKIDTPVILNEPVQQWTENIMYDFLNLNTKKETLSIDDALIVYINNSQTSYPETSLLSEEHELVIETTSSYMSDQLLSMEFYGYQFSGGAHGFDIRTYGNFNPKTGKQYTINEILEESFFAFAKTKFEQELLDQNFTAASENYTKIGFTEDGVNISYDDGIPILPEEIKEITISWADLEPYFKL